MTKIIRLDLDDVNCYLIKTETGFILVDTGGYTFRGRSDKRGLLEEKLKENACVPGALAAVILTHGDVDHSASCRYIRDTYKTKIYIHKADAPLTSGLTVRKVLSNFKFRSPVFALISFLMYPLFCRMTKKIVEKYEEFEADGYVSEETDLKEFGLEARIIHLPGHTEGSIGILFPNGDFISGDVLANAGKPGISPNHWNLKKLKESVYRIKTLPVKTVYPGHGNPFQIAEL